MYCGKTADWIRMPFDLVCGVIRGLSVLDGVVIIQGERAVLRVNLGHPIVISGDLVA